MTSDPASFGTLEGKSPELYALIRDTPWVPKTLPDGNYLGGTPTVIDMTCDLAMVLRAQALFILLSIYL
jgi:hypothetical protein